MQRWRIASRLKYLEVSKPKRAALSFMMPPASLWQVLAFTLCKSLFHAVHDRNKDCRSGAEIHPAMVGLPLADDVKRS